METLRARPENYRNLRVLHVAGERRAFGAFGVVMTVIGYVFIMITLSLVCGVFSPVWTSWRETEKQRHDSGSDGQPA